MKTYMNNKSNHIALEMAVLTIFCLLKTVAMGSVTPDTGKNYIITYSPDSAVTSESALYNLSNSISCPVIQYYDGLGRPTQTVAVNASPGQNNLVTHVEYDNYGRPHKTWQPIGVSSGTLYVGNFASTASSFYSGSNGIPSESKPYSINIYETSPLNRVVSEFGPGAEWQNNNKCVTHRWMGNNTTDSLKVNKYMAQELYNMDVVTKNGLYENGSIYVTSERDEDGHRSFIFTDKLGRVILKRSDLNTGTGSERYLDTYYVYDDLGRLRYVLPPLASENMYADNFNWSHTTTDWLNKYGYYYRYDAHGNCIEKKLPGVNTVYMVYDRADRLVLSQDCNQRTTNRWTFYKYDALGREIMSGSIVLSETSFDTLLSNYSDSLVTESFSSSNTSNYGYSNNFFVSREKLYEIKYYDGYGFISSNWMPGTRASSLQWKSTESLDQYYSTSSRGLMTGTITFLLDNQNFKKYTAYYYDYMGRIVQQNSANFFNPYSNYSYGYDWYSFDYDFKGNLKHKRHYQHGTFATSQYKDGTKYDTDHAGRVTATRHYFGSESSIKTNTTNSYNELGQLRTKTYGNNVETQTYDYNIRGWLKEMSGNYFSEKLYYEKTRSNGVGCYNGNISQSDVRYHAGNHNASLAIGLNSAGTLLQFDYTYDHLNRLRLARTSDSYVRFTEEMDYDRQGNISSLNRCGIYSHGWSNTYTPNHTLQPLDNLIYTYDGNRISAIWDNASNYDPTYTGAQDFHGGGDQQVGEYNYDANGNLFSDFNKGLATIKYNILNLPDTVQHVNGHLLSNSYDATGDKFLAIHRTMNGSGVSMQAGWTYYNYPTGYTIASSTSRMYLDNSEYFSYNLDKILTDDGILVRTNDYSATTPVMGTNYFIRDHLGNVRVVFGDSGSIRQVNNYYPFGMEYGESAQTLTELNYQNYLYGGKELDRKFGINAYDFTGRYYDLTDNRFWSMDPMAEKYYSISPYAYCANNPLRFIDPTGNEYFEDDKNKLDIQKILGSITDLFSINIDTKTKGSISESVATLESNQMEIKKAGDGFYKTAETISTGMPLGSTIFTGVKAINGVAPTAGDVAFSAMDIAMVAPLKFAGKVAKGSTTVIEQAAVHGNSLKSLKPTWGYKLYSTDGKFLKNGITSKLVPESRYNKAFMLDKNMPVKIQFPNRAAAWEWEFQQNLIQRGPLNLNMH